MSGQKNEYPPRISIIGLFAVLTFVFTLPILVLFVQQRQQIGSNAANPTPPPTFQPPSGYIAGYVFHDDNQNGLRDPEEKPFSDTPITITVIKKGAPDASGHVAEVLSNLTTDSAGYFLYRLTDVYTSSVAYVVRVNLPRGYKTIDTNPVLFSTLTPNSRELIQVGLFPLIH